MSWLKRIRRQTEPTVADLPKPELIAAPHAKGFVPPPPRSGSSAVTGAVAEDSELVRLLERHDALAREIMLAEHSAKPESPWQQRIQVIEAALRTLDSEQVAARAIEPKPDVLLPERPISLISVSLTPVPSVEYFVGDERFHYREEIDWAERGTTVVIGELVKIEGDAARLIPETVPDDRRTPLLDHLDGSLFAFATDLRNRKINGNQMAQEVSLAGLAKPCPVCGDWLIWNGPCLSCVRREQRLDRLNAERSRLLSERSKEFEERSRAVEQLPVLRRRLADVNHAIETQTAG